MGTAEKRRLELDQMKGAVIKLQDRLKKMDLEIEKQKAAFIEKREQLEADKKKCEELKRSAMTKKKAIDLIPNAQENLNKLSAIVQNTQKRYDALREKWELKKGEFLQQFHDKKEAMESRKERANDLLAEIKNMRKEMRESANEIRQKEAMVTRMVNKLNKLPKTIDRTSKNIHCG